MLKSAQVTGGGTLDLLNAAALDIANFAMGAAHRVGNGDEYVAAKEAQTFLRDFMVKLLDTSTAEHKWGDRLINTKVHGKPLMNGIDIWGCLDALSKRDFPAVGAPTIEFRDLQDECLKLVSAIGNLKYRITRGIEDMVAEHITPLRVLLQ